MELGARGRRMGVRELKERALELFAQRRFAECTGLYEELLALEPKDPHLYMRHADACRRAGERWKAIASYRTAAELLQGLGCDARARAALKVALELAPRDSGVARAIARMNPQALDTAVQDTPPALLAEVPRHRSEARQRAVGMRQSITPPPEHTSAEPEVRRLSENTLAIRTSPGGRWWVVSSSAPLTAYQVEDLERVAVPREYPVEWTSQH